MINEKIIAHWKQKLANAKSDVERRIAEERLQSYSASPAQSADSEIVTATTTPETKTEVVEVSTDSEPQVDIDELVAERDKMLVMVQKHPHLQSIIEALNAKIARIESSKIPQSAKWAHAKDVGPLTFIFDYKGEVLRMSVDWDAYSDFKPLFDDLLILDRAVASEITSSKVCFSNVEQVLDARALVLDSLLVRQQYRKIQESIMKKAKQMSIEGNIIC